MGIHGSVRYTYLTLESDTFRTISFKHRFPSTAQVIATERLVVRGNARAEPPAPEDALFHCQQAAEKALKGFLVWHDQPFPKTHDLGRLGKQAVELDPTLEPLIDEVVEFAKYAWMFRYPAMLTSHL